MSKKQRYIIMVTYGNVDPFCKWASGLTKKGAEDLIPFAKEKGFRDAKVVSDDDYRQLIKADKQRRKDAA